ncbi:MAG: MBL fold metallo-hydrolase [Acidobacteria bacterium]|nr:MBL fold metallo-hydrolase [Acidobacteriota bacterium]
MHGPLTITVLGSGTSVGIPTIGCDCEVCLSADPRDRRLRPSILVRYDGHNVLIDTGPDLREQALRAGLRHLDAVLYTHGHADHILGLDDIRPFNFHRKEPIPIYGSGQTIEHIRRTFGYIFDTGQSESSRPKIETRVFTDQPIELFGLAFEPLPLAHGSGRTYGFRFGAAAYLTDHSDIPEAALERLYGLDVLFLDALRHRPHPTHSTVERSLAHVEQLKPNRAFFTHICHELMHAEVEATLPGHVRLAYDGLEIAVGVAG